MKYKVPYQTTGKRPVGILSKGYVEVEADTEAEAVTQAKALIRTPHVIFPQGIVEVS